MKLAHARALLVAFPAWLAASWWLWPRAARAEALASEVRLYDWTSVGYAAALGLLGGFLALIVALATDRRVVLQVLGEAARNALVSPIAGAGTYLGLKAAATLGWFAVGTDARFLLIVVSGWSGVAFFGWVRERVRAKAAQAAEFIDARGKTS